MESSNNTPRKDFGLSADELKAKYDKEHPVHGKEDWQYEVANQDSTLGYWEWVRDQIESRYYDDCDQCRESSTDKTFVQHVGYVCSVCLSALQAK